MTDTGHEEENEAVMCRSCTEIEKCDVFSDNLQNSGKI